MNWDTRELSLWIDSNDEMRAALKSEIGNELMFMRILCNIIDITNHQFAEERRIDSSKVNGNEIYVDFCELNGFETEGWK